MASRVYLMADRGDGRVRSFGTCTKAPEHVRGNRFSLSFKGDAIYGTNRQRIVIRDARAWWLVEAESAEAARRGIAAWEAEEPDRRTGAFYSSDDGWTAAPFGSHQDAFVAGYMYEGRILDSGGAR